VLRSDGSGDNLLMVPAGGSAMPASSDSINGGMHYIKMNGREVFRFATRVMVSASTEAIQKAGLTLDDIQWVIPHQANKRIIDAAARGLKLPMERIIVNLQDYGNTSTASIPIAACEAVADGRLNSGDNIVLVGFGAGLTWGALTATWSGPFPDGKPIRFRRYRRLARMRALFLRFLRRLEGYIWGRRRFTKKK
jgi:3-oxoacyl-[acyl-carrier-protein] synthase-3